MGSYISQDPIGLGSGEPNCYAYPKNPIQGIDPLGLLEVYGYQQRGGGNGWEKKYELKFTPIPTEIGKLAAGRNIVGKVINRIGNLISFIDNKPAGPYRPIRDFLACGMLDAKLEVDYKKAGYSSGQRLTPGQAKDILGKMFKENAEMESLYPPPDQLMKEAEDNSKNDFMYKARPNG